MKKFISVVLVLFTIVVANNLQEKNHYSSKIVFENTFGSVTSESNNESIATALKEEGNVEVVLELKDSYRETTKPTDELSLAQAQSLLKAERAKVKKHYSTSNKELLNSLNIDESKAEIEVSNYAPFIFTSFNESTRENIIEEVLDFVEYDEIECVYIKKQEQWVTDEVSNDVNEYGSKISYTEEFLPNGNTLFPVIIGGVGGGTSYTGKGVVMGILDPGIVDSNHANFKNTNLTVRREWYYPETVTKHATTVASIAGGLQGIAPGADILSVEVCGSLNSEIEWLLDHNVNVINMSFFDSDSSSSLGTYTSNAAYIDSIVKNNHVTVVGSSGNRGEGDTYVTSPKTGYNVIAVGSTNVAQSELSSFSSYKTQFTISKPNLVARGEDYVITDLGYQGSGTSYASPVVTGTVALMMEKRPELMYYPELVMSLLTANADTMANYTTHNFDGYNEQVGAGLNNLQATLDNINNTVSFSYKALNTSDVFVSEKSVYISVGQTIKASFTSLVNTEGKKDITLVTDYDLRLYDTNGNMVTQRTSLSNTELLTYTASSSGTYTIKIFLYNSKKTDLADWCGYAYRIS